MVDEACQRGLLGYVTHKVSTPLPPCGNEGKERTSGEWKGPPGRDEKVHPNPTDQ